MDLLKLKIISAVSLLRGLQMLEVLATKRNVNIKPFFTYLKSLLPMGKEEYNEKYPRDKYYDSELYYTFKLRNDIHNFNSDMIPRNAEEAYPTSQAFFSRNSSMYVSRRESNC